MEWKENLPDVDKWQPDTARNETLSTGLLLTCQAAQVRIVSGPRLSDNSISITSTLGWAWKTSFVKSLPSSYPADTP